MKQSCIICSLKKGFIILLVL